MAATNELMIERGGQAGSAARRRANFKIFQGDRRLPQVIGLTFVYVFGTLAIFNVTFGLVLALTTTSISKLSGGFFRGVWLLPRMSPSVLYILLWVWAINPSEVGLLNQILMHVLGLGKPLD